MISLDKKILDISSPVAERMVSYGYDGDIHILIPDTKKRSVSLSSAVHAESTGGNKIQQFFRLYGLGKKLTVDSITTQDPFFTGLVGLRLRKKLGVSLEVQVHGDFFSTEYYKEQNNLKYRIAKYVIMRADKVRVVGERVRESVIALGVPAERVYVAPVAIDVARIESHTATFDLHEQYPQFSSICLTMSRLESVKHLSWLLTVFAEVRKERPNMGLVIVGDGSERKRLESQVVSLGLQGQVVFVPWTDDPVSYYKSADALLFPSLSEGYGLAPMEANIAGCPVIMNNVGVAGYELPVGSGVTILDIDDADGWKQAIKAV